ncbi:class I SAM-dependent methyltransferase [Streptomyces sp. PKU-EA00015]|uniref:class I SAM-dependent methyltransferase n=1 Tax=Streptomyces sp. PKU-EA00015 TaxID=2748326 RepID=UPI0015A31861|nr:class I SAM-dependent methyltransferase [Streptomyces sp. PKU-EA00015]NWF27164.1 class I SAM-dependent methyltransferase [Streptomyces sp. PKU-EA00015]
MSQTSTPAEGTAAEELPRPERFADVKGWFWPVDQLIFDWFLTRQRDTDMKGDLLELGAYMGKSAIFLGGYLREGETFTVCDLFDSEAPDDPNSAEMDRSYATLTRRAFEANYLSFHDELPTVVQAPTSVITSRVEAATCRFVHVDASHLYEHVHGDVAAARELLLPDGIVAFDDFRAEHCPGVSAAVWGAVSTTGLKPIVITGSKLYGTWGDPAPFTEELLEFLATRTDVWHGVEEVAGLPLIRIKGPKAQPPAPPVSRNEPLPRPAPEPDPATPPPAPAPSPAAAPARRSLARRLARDLLPPILTRALTSGRSR